MCSLTGGQKGKSVKSCSNWFYKFKSLTALGSVHPSGRCRPLLVGEQALNPAGSWGEGQASAAASVSPVPARGGDSASDPLDLGFRKRGGRKVECPSNLTSRPLADTQVIRAERPAPEVWESAALYLQGGGSYRSACPIYIYIGMSGSIFQTHRKGIDSSLEYNF